MGNGEKSLDIYIYHILFGMLSNVLDLVMEMLVK